MTFQRISRPSSSNSPTQKKASSLTTQPLAIQALRKSDRPHTRDEAEDEVFQQHRIKRPLRFDHNFANIPVNHPEDNRPEGIARPQLPASTSNTPTGLPYRLRAGVEHLSGMPHGTGLRRDAAVCRDGRLSRRRAGGRRHRSASELPRLVERGQRVGAPADALRNIAHRRRNPRRRQR